MFVACRTMGGGIGHGNILVHEDDPWILRHRQDLALPGQLVLASNGPREESLSGRERDALDEVWHCRRLLREYWNPTSMPALSTCAAGATKLAKPMTSTSFRPLIGWQKHTFLTTGGSTRSQMARSTSNTSRLPSLKTPNFRRDVGSQSQRFSRCCMRSSLSIRGD